MKEEDIQSELDKIFSLKNNAALDEAIMDFVVNKLGWSEDIINDFYNEFSKNPRAFYDVKRFMHKVL